MFEKCKNMAMSASILCWTVCISDVLDEGRLGQRYQIHGKLLPFICSSVKTPVDGNIFTFLCFKANVFLLQLSIQFALNNLCE